MVGNLGINLGGASANVGLHIKGLWFGTFDLIKVDGGNANSVVVKVETSQKGGNNFGTYINTFIAPDLKAIAAAKVFQILQTSDDTAKVTHLHVLNGCVDSITNGFYLSSLADSKIPGVATTDTTNDYYVESSTGVVLESAEVSSGAIKNFSFGTDNADITVIPASRSVTPAFNTANLTPAYMEHDKIQLFPSTTEQNYYARFQSNCTAPNAFNLKVSSREALILFSLKSLYALYSISLSPPFNSSCS